MTAARQERKSRHGRALRLAGLLLPLVAMAAVIAAQAATTERVVVNRHTGLAIDGFDPVAYFTEGAPREGRPEWELRSVGAIWRFCNEGNRAAFEDAPEVYAPRFGGHDPTSVARGRSAPGHPALWLIAGKRLYLFYSAEGRAAFARNPESAIEAAERRWPDVQRTLVRD